MQVMNVTNYSNSKQNQPNFGMVLDFEPQVIERLGKDAFQSLQTEVAGLVTVDKCNPTVKGQLKGLGDVLLSTKIGDTVAQDKTACSYISVSKLLNRMFAFIRPE